MVPQPSLPCTRLRPLPVLDVDSKREQSCLWLLSWFMGKFLDKHWDGDPLGVRGWGADSAPPSKSAKCREQLCVHTHAQSTHTYACTCMCVHVCVCTCVHTHMCTHMKVHTCVNRHWRTCVSMHGAHICRHTCTRAMHYTRTCTRHTHARVRTYMKVHVCTVHSCTDACMHRQVCAECEHTCTQHTHAYINVHT